MVGTVGLEVTAVEVADSRVLFAIGAGFWNTAVLILEGLVEEEEGSTRRKRRWKEERKF